MSTFDDSLPPWLPPDYQPGDYGLVIPPEFLHEVPEHGLPFKILCWVLAALIILTVIPLFCFLFGPHVK